MHNEDSRFLHRGHRLKSFFKIHKPVQLIRTALSKDVNSMLPAVQDMYCFAAWNRDFLKKYSSQNLEGLVIPSGLQGMLNGEDFRSLNVIPSSRSLRHLRIGALEFDIHSC